ARAARTESPMARVDCRRRERKENAGGVGAAGRAGGSAASSGHGADDQARGSQSGGDDRRGRAGDARRVSGRNRRRGRNLRGDEMDVRQMMKQAQQMQERLQKQMAEMRVEASSGGGLVTVVVNGNKQIQTLKIDPEVVSKDDVEMLQDLIVAAVNDAQRKADEEMSRAMGGMLPPGMKIPG